ncbi:DUF1345 domain-containing protein [Pararhizobium sp. BT-229]|uniref:DUF1345 domain-containing protein n=1 Tax=Pararhizobium sp. BT-229 TaxID=2986923 RepID=UPI0021F6B992|nr:DUF1345 domain-containing protein [Pararhizobium sp. BT-229]MCV9965487.1 DUF1345 domain-containing protein [Pararhizobium sp. BT-229]
MSKIDRKIAHRRHAPFYAGGICAVITFLVCLFVEPKLAVGLSAVVFFSVYLVLIARRLPALTGAHLKRNAAGTDEPAIIISAVTLAAAAVSLVSLFLALNKDGAETVVDLIIAFSSVTLGWLTIHTMAAMHYAHRYWSPEMNGDERDNHGLDFPGTKEPGGYDFLYFAFVIGMTAQTSDIAITSTGMRKVNLLHAVVTFFFNTVLVAAAVNAAVSLA